MKRLLAAVLLPAFVIGCSQSTAPSVDKNQVISSAQVEEGPFNTAGLPTLTFALPSMSCETICVPKARETLAKQPGVKDVSVDLDSHTATVAIERDAFDSDLAIQALEQADFTDVELTADAS